MTTYSPAVGADVRPDVRIETHSYRHPRQMPRAWWDRMTNPLWLLLLVGGCVLFLTALGAVSAGVGAALA